jgi:hypothetical protein
LLRDSSWAGAGATKINARAAIATATTVPLVLVIFDTNFQPDSIDDYITGTSC